MPRECVGWRARRSQRQFRPGAARLWKQRWRSCGSVPRGHSLRSRA